MKKSVLLILVLCLMVSCKFDVPTSTKNDRLKYTGSGLTGAFGEAFDIINDKCIACHEGKHDAWANYLTEAAWLSATDIIGQPLVVAGNPTGSQIYSRLAIVSSSGDMPDTTGSIVFTTSDADKIKVWIEGISAFANILDPYKKFVPLDR